MTSAADWKNSNMQMTNKAATSTKTGGEQGLDSRDRKFQQLQSSVFGGGPQDQAPIEYDREVKKNAFGSTADWKTEAGMAKPNNGGSNKVDTYGKKQ